MNPQSAEVSRVDSVPLLDVKRGNEPFRESILQAIAEVVDSGRYLYGPQVQQLEQAMAERCGVKHAVGCASGSDALLLSLMALGIGPEDEVLLPSFTFFATASAVTRLGARPVFVEIDPHSYNISPHHCRALISPRTRAIIPVHLFGQCANMDEIAAIASRFDLRIVEDAAQSIGASWRETPAGGWGTTGCFSYYPTKNLGGMGDGGMITTQDDAVATKLRRLAAHGMNPRYYHSEIGINSRLDTIQAAILLVKLRQLETWTAARQANARRYAQLIEQADLSDHVELPTEDARTNHVWNQFTIRIKGGQRDAVRQWMADHQVGSEIYYPIPLHRQECFQYLGYREGELPFTELAAKEVLSLPNFPELTEREAECVVSTLRSFFKSGARSNPRAA